ncbi:MAG: hypothetical protein ACKOYK_06165 [Cyanobium sp.]|jgi:hypothetical protein
MAWLQRWNFIARARLERELWEAFEQGDDLEALVARAAAEAQGGDDDQRFRLEVWQTTLVRIRKIEALMHDQRPPGGPPPGSSPGPRPPAADPD